MSRVVTIENLIDYLRELVVRTEDVVRKDSLELFDALVIFRLVETRVSEIEVSKLKSSLEILRSAVSVHAVAESIDERRNRDILA